MLIVNVCSSESFSHPQKMFQIKVSYDNMNNSNTNVYKFNCKYNLKT